MSPQHRSAEALHRRAQALLGQAEHEDGAQIDRFFAGLFLVQWVSRIAYAWKTHASNDDLFTLIVIGAAIATIPCALVVWKPGTVATRHAIAVAQVIYGAILVHVTRGTSDAHVHMFVSLACLALYRDHRVVLSASAVVVLELFATGNVKVGTERTILLVLTATILAVICRRSARDRAEIALKDARLEGLQTDFLASMSHELRTPMTAILGSADLLDSDQSMEQRSHVARIQRNGQQLLSVLDDMSDATKNERRISKPVDSTPRRLDCSVLLAEDGIDNQKIVAEYLQRAGVRVTIAPNGAVALAEVAAASERGKPFDLILMDMQMPTLDGYAATTELRKRGYGGPILALTARAMAGDRTRCIDAGCTDYLSKPITRDRLVHAVATHALGSAATLRPAPLAEEPLFSDCADANDMQELLDGFVTRLRQNAEQAEAAFAAEDAPQVEQIAHRLRGAAGSFGFMPISEAAAALEDAAKAGADVAEKLNDLVSLCRRARTRVLARAA